MFTKYWIFLHKRKYLNAECRLYKVYLHFFPQRLNDVELKAIRKTTGDLCSIFLCSLSLCAIQIFSTLFYKCTCLNYDESGSQCK